MDNKRKKIISVITTIIVLAIAGLVFAATTQNDNHYYVDVVKEDAIATDEDNNLELTEKIVKKPGMSEFNATELDYEVTLKNISQDSNKYNEVAILLDTSYSMGQNDPNNVAKEKARQMINEMNKVKNISFAVTNNARCNYGRTDSYYANIALDSYQIGDGNDLNEGLQKAYDTFTNPANAPNTYRYLIVFTDGTDDVASKMQDLVNADPCLKIITVLFDMSSNTYVDSAGNSLCGDLYIVNTLDKDNDSNLEKFGGIDVLDISKICREMNKTVDNITVENTFSANVIKYFNIDIAEAPTGSTVEITRDSNNNVNGYKWNVDSIRYQDTTTLKFKITLNTSMNIDAEVIFKELSTNQEQNISFYTYEDNNKKIESNKKNFRGTDARSGTESTVIKICQGYDLKIRAVNELNTSLPVAGIKFEVKGTKEENGVTSEVCNLTKTTDSNGYITITADEARALRIDGTISYRVTPNINGVIGYSNTDMVPFEITNATDTRKISTNSNGADEKTIIIDTADEIKRIVKVTIPIKSARADFKLNAFELGNSNTKVGGAEFQLIQPKLNNKHEMSVLTGITDAEGVIHFNPTVMTVDGTYIYYLVNNSVPSIYDTTAMTKISVTFVQGKIVDVTRAENSNVDVRLEPSPENNVTIDVRLENTNVDPFDLQINLEDDANGDKLEGVTYFIRRWDKNNVAWSTYATTDANGQINIQVPATGDVRLEVTEQSPKAGYAPDTVTKEFDITRDNGVVQVKQVRPTTYTNWDQNSDHTNLIVNLKSTKKAEQNIVEVSLVEAEQSKPYVPVGAGVTYKLTDTNDRTDYFVASDRNGKLRFTLANKPQGRYLYTLEVLSSTIPTEYDDTRVETSISFNLDFDNDGYVIGESVNTNSTVIEEEYSVVSNDNSTEYTTYITIGYYINIANSVPFTLQLTDQNSGAAIKGAKYDITIEWDVNGVTKTKEIKERFTNQSGIISTRITKGNPTRIYVTEKAASAGYYCDLTTQEIQVQFKNNGTTSIVQSPYDLGATNTDEPNMGAYDNNGTIFFKHQNRKRSSEDTYFNLTLNKVTTTGAYVNGVYVGITSEDGLLDKNGNPLNLVMESGAQGSDGMITIDYKKYIEDKPNQNVTFNETIRVPGLGTTVTEKTFHVNLFELEQTPTGLVEKAGTKVIVELTYKLITGRVYLTDAKTIYGNRLIDQTTKKSSATYDEQDKQDMVASEDSLGVYLSSLYLDYYTNFEDLGNLELDFKKQDKLNNPLVGAEYEIIVVNPNNFTFKYNKTIDNTTGSIELEGLNVAKGSYIYITETKAPIGYALNDRTEVLSVTNIDDSGEITLAQSTQAYPTNRLKLTKLPSYVTTADILKSSYEIVLTDYQIDTFEFGIDTIDSTTLNSVGGYQFDISTSTGAQSRITTNASGTATANVGGNSVSTTVNYTISVVNPAQYYKRISNNIVVNVVYDQAGNVDVLATQNAQTDWRYNSLWNIESLGTEGNIKIQLKIEHNAPLTVYVDTIDKITNANISSAQYRITDSVDLPGTGSNRIDVGYTIENGTRNYKISQTTIGESYAPASEKTFSVTYNNTYVDANSLVLNSTENMDTISYVNGTSIRIRLYVEPKVPFEITNLYYFNNNTKLQGSNFEVTEMSSNDTHTGTTDSNGKTGIYSGIFGNSGSTDVKTYKIRQTSAATGYATVEDFYVKVTYNTNREIDTVELVDSNGLATTNKFVTVGKITSSSYSNYNGNNKGIVAIQVLNYPEFKINITDVDRRDGTTPISGATYEISSKYTLSDGSNINFTSTSGVVTNATGLGVAHLDKTKEDTVVYYTVKETAPGTNYQSLGTEIVIEVAFDSDGYVRTVSVQNDSNLSAIEHAEKIDPVVNPEDNFVVNLELKNNPLLKVNIIAEDSANHNIKIQGIGFHIKGREKNSGTLYSNSSATNTANLTGTAQNVFTNISGEAVAYMDRTLENKSMKYNITQTRKTAGYGWIGGDIVLEASYNANGKLASKPNATQNGNYVNVVSWDADNFEITLEIFNDEIKEFGISVSAYDVYDSSKKINDLKIDAYLLEDYDNTDNPKGIYKLMGDNALLTGADRDADGIPDLDYGADYKTIGKYTEGANSETLALKIRNQTSGSTGSAGYYLPTGYYKENQYFEDAFYRAITELKLIKVNFNDDGVITGASVMNRYEGNEIAGSSYLEVSHTQYTLSVKIKMYPLFNLDVNAMDNYTYQNEIDENGKPIKLNGSNYTISTSRHNATTSRDEYVTVGYIGDGHYFSQSDWIHGRIYTTSTGNFHVPIEANSTRKFYVFENSEPVNYQKYSPRRINEYKQRLVAIISIEFDEFGEVKTNSINYIKRGTANENGQIAFLEPYNAEGGGYLSHIENLKEYKYHYELTDNKETNTKRRVEFYIGYALTTKIHVRAVDDISDSPIAHIRMYPFVANDNDTVNKISYEYNTHSYRYTNSNGDSAWTYWGAAEANDNNNYVIGSAREGNDYNGYYFPNDLASPAIGGSGNSYDYYAKLDVSYGSDGKINDVTSLGHDTWNDNNVKNITWDSATGNIYIDMLYSRKFQVVLNKVDYYDSTINTLNASFKVISNKGLQTNISAKAMTTLGKVYKDTSVKYTLSETSVPNGYYPLPSTIDYFVKFDKNGNISTNSITSESEYFKALGTTTNTQQANKLSPDLSIAIKNKPALMLDVKVIDKFYKTIGLPDAYLRVTSSKGDNAAGNPQTDSNGYASITAGPVYPGETVKYYISQTNTVPEYYANYTTVVLEVKYNDLGKIEEYRIISGNEVVNNFNDTRYKATRKIDMEIMNMPKDLKIGLYKYDEVTNQPMEGVKFTLKKENYNTGADLGTENLVTDVTGTVIQTIDTFSTSYSGKIIKYTLHEEETPNTYRKMEDIVYLVTFNADGSMNSCNQIVNSNGVLNTNVNVTLATNGHIQNLNNKRVHFKAIVSNDNAYDVIIKNVDANYFDANGDNTLGIEGTKYAVNINGRVYNPNLTDTNGKTKIAKLTDSGDITIDISENSVGEGYKDDINNTAAIIVTKGQNEYSLELNSNTIGYIDSKNAETSKAKIEVDEEHGTVTITFKNETKTELTVIKQDIDTMELLKDAKFEVKAQKLDDNLDPDGNEQVLTTPVNCTTDTEGKLSFDLGVAPQSEVWEYTFKEITAPEGYNLIAEVKMQVRYDQYGRIISQNLTQPTNRLLPMLEHSSNINCRHMLAFIYNGDISPAYKIKVVTRDADTKNIINGNEIFMKVTDRVTGNLIPVQPKKVSSMKNDGVSTAITNNLGMDGEMYTDEQVKSPDIPTPIIIDSGLVFMDNIDYEGSINVEVSQQKFVDGYVPGNQRTDGNIKLTTEYIPHLDSDPTLSVTVDDRDGLEVNVSEATKTITITLYNESQVTFDITTQLYGDDNIGIQDVTYDITSEIVEDLAGNVPTTLNVTTPLSDANGKTSRNAGKAYAGKKILYKLHQNIHSDYTPVDDIEVLIEYDSRGYIKYYELLSSEDNARLEETTKDRTIVLIVKTRKNVPPYKIVLEKHAMDTDDNQAAYGTIIPGAKFEITVKQTYGKATETWIGTTDENGQIEGPQLLGYGPIEIIAKELEAPEGYKLADTVIGKISRDQYTGDIINNTAEVNIGRNEDNTEIYIIPLDEQLDNKYTIKLNKISSATNKYITESQAKFKIEIEKFEEDGTVSYKDTIQSIYTNHDGEAIKANIDIPDAGEYKVTITELEAPEGYKVLDNPLVYTMKVENKDPETRIITGFTGVNEKANVKVVKDQLISIDVKNDVDEEILDDEYSLDITKVDAATGLGIVPSAVFKVKLPDEQETSVYTETKTTLLGDGKLDYCYIEQDKDYQIRLTHMKKPTVEEVEQAENQKITYTYTFEEVKAPDGYELNTTPVDLEIDFIVETDATTGEKRVIIDDARSLDTTIMTVDRTNPDSDIKVKADILNNEEVKSYLITYDGNTPDNSAVDIPSPQVKLPGSAVTVAGTNPSPSRYGYRFVEWNTEPDGTGTPFAPASQYAIDANVTLYAIWEVATYTIKYEENPPIDSNTGVAIGLVTDMPADQIKTHGINIDLDDDNLTPTIPNVANYYEFAGWNTEKDGTGTHYNERDTYTVDADLTLYAEWNYIIHYKANVPTDSSGFPMSTPNDIPLIQKEKVNSSTDAIIDDLSIYTNAPTMNGYKFKEWNTAQDGTGDTYNPNDTYTSRKGIDLYAIWQYEITYDENIPRDENGFAINVTISNMPVANPQVTDVNNTAIVDNTTDNPSVPTMSPDDYVFKEWNTKPDGTGDTYNPDDVYSGNISVTLYAIWEESQKLYLKVPEGSQYEIGENTKDIYEDGDLYISNVIPQFSLDKQGTQKQKGTTVEEFKNNIDTNAQTIEIKDKDGNVLGNTDLVGTGAKLYLTRKDERIEIYISVIGDLNGDGKITVNDYSELLLAYKKKSEAKQYYIDKYPSEDLNIQPEVMYKSSDLNDNGKGSDVNDVSVMALIRGYKTNQGGVQGLKLWRGEN